MMKSPDKISLSDSQIKQVFDKIDNFQVELNTVDYNEELFRGYRNIIVVGNPRSGTTITGKMLADTLSYEYMDEMTFRCRNFTLFKKILNTGEKVIQAPGISHIAHFLPSDEDLVVFMVRPWSDIVKSLHRISGLSNWILTDTLYDYELYNRKNPGVRTNCVPAVDLEVEDYFKKHINRDSYFLEIPYKMWKYYQRDKIKNWVQLNYESMRFHPMWIDKEERKHFTRKQTK